MTDSTARDRMMEAHLQGRGVRDPAVLAAMRAVPRERFVPPELAEAAYADHPLPIGHGQTISQPYIVAAMTELIKPKAGDRVLEVGTGSGYQAAVLAEIVGQVYSVEANEHLAQTARGRLAELGYDNVVVTLGDGRRGWPEHAPYDGILVTAAPEAVPQALVEQLRPGGRMCLPVGPVHGVQELVLLTRDAGGEVQREAIMSVRFVPLI